MIDRVLSPANGERCAAELRKTCDELGIAFVDLNHGLRPLANEDEWLFVDRAHLTDRGYAACADCLSTLVE